MATPVPWLSFERPQSFETAVIQATAGGAVAGTGHLFLASFSAAYPLPITFVPFPAYDSNTLFSFATTVLFGALAAIWPGSGKRRWLGLALSGVVLLAPALFEVHVLWRLALGSFGAGMLWAHAQARANDKSWSNQRESWTRRIMSGLVLSILVTVGARVALLLGIAADSWAMPGLMVAGIGGGVLGLFTGLGRITAHLATPMDEVEAELEAALPKLSGELADAARRALERYRQCAQLLAQLPRDAGREDLAQTLTRTTKDVAKLTQEWSELERLIREVKPDSLEQQISSLRTKASASTDTLAKRQLEAAAAALDEGRQRATLLIEQRERLHAKLHSSVALLECARLALLGIRGGEAQLKAAELAGVSERLKALVAAQGEDAKWVDALGTGAELAHVESRQRIG